MLGKKHKAAEMTLPRGQVAPLYFLLPQRSQLKRRLALPQGPCLHSTAPHVRSVQHQHHAPARRLPCSEHVTRNSKPVTR